MNETALVIGGTGKIGKVFSMFFVKKGIKLIIASRDKHKFYDFINFLKTKKYDYKSVTWKKLDISSDNSVRRFVINAKKNRDITYLIIASLIGSRDVKKLFDFKVYRRDYQSLLANPIFLVESILKNMRIKKKGKIIITSSMLGLKVPDFSLYTHLKFSPSINTLVAFSGLIHYVRNIAVREKENNISCCSLLPGFFTKTKKRDKFIRTLEKKIPSSRIGNEKDLEVAINFLLSENNYFNGQSLLIDGGFSVV